MKLKPVANRLPLLSVLALAVLLASMAYTPALAATTVQHPRVWVEGDLVTDVVPGVSVFTVTAEEPDLQLPFERDGNITIPIASIKFSDQFVANAEEVASGTDSVATNMTFTKDLLQYSNGIKYIVLSESNTADLKPDTWYSSNVLITIDADETESGNQSLPITNDYYILATAKLEKTGANADEIADMYIKIWLVFQDEGGTERKIVLNYDYGRSALDIIASSTLIDVWLPGASVYKTYQFKIQDILDEAGVSWVLTQLTEIKYAVSLKTGATLTSGGEWGCKGYFMNVIVGPDKIYVHSDKVENLVGRTLNDADGNPQGNDETIVFPESYGEVITIYGAEVDEICDLTIPFRYEPEPEIATAGSDGFTYKWTFQIPEPQVSGSFSLSNTKLLMRSWFDGSLYDYLYVAGANKLDEINTLTVDETTGYWEKELLTGLNPGYKYDVEAKVSGLPEDVFMELTAPAAWWTGKGIVYRILMFIYMVLSALGIKAAGVRRNAMRYRVPKR